MLRNWTILETRCVEDRQKLADIVAKSVQLLQERNVKLTTLKFLQSLAVSIASELSGRSCSEMAATLIIMLKA
jgi:hypothetical protein